MLANLSRTLAKRYFSITPTSQKIATGLVGLPVSDDGMKELKEVSQSILEQIQVRQSKNILKCGCCSFIYSIIQINYIHKIPMQ